MFRHHPCFLRRLFCHTQSHISDCNPDLESVVAPARMKAHLTGEEKDSEEYFMRLQHSEILTVRCTGEKEMYIMRHDPGFTCCLTPHSSITRLGYTISMNDWTTGVMPCECMCPRNIETTLRDLPYGTYTFSLKFDTKEKHSVDLDFIPEFGYNHSFGCLLRNT